MTLISTKKYDRLRQPIDDFLFFRCGRKMKKSKISQRTKNRLNMRKHESMIAYRILSIVFTFLLFSTTHNLHHTCNGQYENSTEAIFLLFLFPN